MMPLDYTIFNSTGNVFLFKTNWAAATHVSRMRSKLDCIFDKIQINCNYRELRKYYWIGEILIMDQELDADETTLFFWRNALFCLTSHFTILVINCAQPFGFAVVVMLSKTFLKSLSLFEIPVLDSLGDLFPPFLIFISSQKRLLFFAFFLIFLPQFCFAKASRNPFWRFVWFVFKFGSDLAVSLVCAFGRLTNSQRNRKKKSLH